MASRTKNGMKKLKCVCLSVMMAMAMHMIILPELPGNKAMAKDGGLLGNDLIWEIPAAIGGTVLVFELIYLATMNTKPMPLNLTALGATGCFHYNAVDYRYSNRSELRSDIDNFGARPLATLFVCRW